MIAGRFRRRTGDDNYVVHCLRRVQHVGKGWLGQEIGCVGTALANGDAEEVSIPVCGLGGLAERSLWISDHFLGLEAVTAVLRQVRRLAVIRVNEDGPTSRRRQPRGEVGGELMHVGRRAGE